MITALEYLNSKIKENEINSSDIKIEKVSLKYKNDINSLEKESKLEKPNYVFTYNNNLVGFVKINKEDKEIYSISNFAIKPEYRGKGLGKDTFKMILDFIKKSFKVKQIELWVYFDNDPARSIYYSFGFKSNSTLFTGSITKDKSGEVEITKENNILKELINIYNSDLKDLDKSYLPNSSALVLLKDNGLLAGCGYNTYKEGNNKYLTLFYPVGIDNDSLQMFLDNTINHYKLDVNKFHIQHLNGYKLFSVISKFSKPEQEQLILKI